MLLEFYTNNGKIDDHFDVKYDICSYLKLELCQDKIVCVKQQF